MTKLNKLLLICLIIWIVATLIEGFYTKNFLGYAIRNIAEVIIFLMGVYVGTKIK